MIFVVSLTLHLIPGQIPSALLLKYVLITQGYCKNHFTGSFSCLSFTSSIHSSPELTFQNKPDHITFVIKLYQELPTAFAEQDQLLAAGYEVFITWCKLVPGCLFCPAPFPAAEMPLHPPACCFPDILLSYLCLECFL